MGVLPDRREAFFELLGLDELIDDPRFENPFLGTENRLALFELVGEVTATKPTQYWVDAFADIGIRRAPVNDYVTATNDPEVLANAYVAEVADENGEVHRVVGSPILMSDTPTAPSARAPELGEHTELILLELGFDWPDIAAMRDESVI